MLSDDLILVCICPSNEVIYPVLLISCKHEEGKGFIGFKK